MRGLSEVILSSSLLLLCFLFSSCDTENAPECFQASGEIIQKEVALSTFEEIIVYDRINLFIEQGDTQKVVIETGKNLMSDITAEVKDNRLYLKNDNSCNFFRDYNLTNVYVTIPNLTWLQNAGNTIIESVGELHFPNIWLRSLNQEEVKGVYTNGDFKLNLISENIRITGDDFSNFFLSGKTDNLNIFIAAGDGRVEAGELIAETVELQHRGTNKVIVNPQQVLKGEIRSTGDVISINRPPVVQVESFYTGKLYFK
ncbi:head GIN domain-containing protein [Salinimicrobium soli]|uniref:head GIN domain-containing protein n=1 Tax=Salinimicrobium soli TaxID=1254399 RepID=UPI003AB0D120